MAEGQPRLRAPIQECGVVSYGLCSPGLLQGCAVCLPVWQRPGQPLSHSQMGVLCGRPLFQSSQSTDGACIASALTLLRWQSPS